jgi:hypothetical protein
MAKQAAVSQFGRAAADAAMPAIDQLLDQWFAARLADPHFKPTVSAETPAPTVIDDEMPNPVRKVVEDEDEDDED